MDDSCLHIGHLARQFNSKSMRHHHHHLHHHLHHRHRHPLMLGRFWRCISSSDTSNHERLAQEVQVRASVLLRTYAWDSILLACTIRYCTQPCSRWTATAGTIILVRNLQIYTSARAKKSVCCATGNKEKFCVDLSIFGFWLMKLRAADCE